MASSCSIKKRLSSLSNLLFRHIRHRHNTPLHHFTNTSSSNHNRYISSFYFFNNKHLLASDTSRSFLKPYAFTSCYRSFTTDTSGTNDHNDSGQVEAEAQGFFDYNDNNYTTSIGEVVGSGEVVVDQDLVFNEKRTEHPKIMGQDRKAAMISFGIMEMIHLFPHLMPPPLPPPFSGKSWIEQYKRFREKRIEIGCPSFLWMLAYPSVQIPCFILGTASVRRMALDHYPGFESGGALWFQNLTELPHGATGCTFPLLIATLHLINVRLSFEKSSLTALPNLIGVLAKYYRFYLHCLTIPLFFTGFYLPQGSLIYWSANSSITLVQQLVMKHPLVREKLGLPAKLAPVDSGQSRDLDGLEATFTVPLVKKPIHELSLLEIFNLSIKHLSKGEQERAASLLRMVLEKDPEYVRALVVMGQMLIKDEKLVEATEYLDRAVTKLLLVGHPTEVEEIDQFILASLWSGVALAKQGKVAEGIVHLERIANMKEPEDAKTKAHYCDGLLVLSSALASVGRNDEAEKYLRILTSYDPAYDEYLKHVESEGSNFADDLENSRRKDY
uniref:Albino3-like protein 2, chloroplastic n=1 Tax=Tanacetum cinerariifolium TaxID=118510 RepID=A0A6L2JQX7_TANCI|nr:albino3-like protein 2, chloroplastic [Tanacetum cinerariifolium]